MVYVTGILNPTTYDSGLTRGLVGFPAAEKYLNFDGHPSKIYARTVGTQAAVTRVDSLLGAQASPKTPAGRRLPALGRALPGRRRGALDTLFLGLGAVTLLVGAIRCINIMVISALERRRETGLRRALGATRGRSAPVPGQAILRPW
jgi:putative ABC transport system permease protein